jgi:hypothetical protein
MLKFDGTHSAQLAHVKIYSLGSLSNSSRKSGESATHPNQKLEFHLQVIVDADFLE